MSPPPPHTDNQLLFPAIVAISSLIIALISVAGCDADTGASSSGETSQDTDITSDYDAGPEEDVPPPEERDPQDLPGADTDPGEDPCDGNANCRWDAHGVGTENPFDDEGIGDALLDEHGAITLDDTSETDFFAWIPNTAEGTISRVDTEARIEVARYRTGPAQESLEPSRTTVDSQGSVYVANRDHQSVTKVALNPACNSVGGSDVTTSTGPDDLLDWGDDDCIEWSQDLSGFGSVDAVAIQQTDDGSFLWVGAEEESIWKLDAEDGRILFRTDAPVRPNGFALDESGGLWMSTYFETEIGRLDTVQCRDHGSCESEVCQNQVDDCVKSRLDAPDMVHGIAVDDQGRVWLGGDLMRFEPEAAGDDRWTHIELDFPVFGVASDGDEWIYAAATGEGLYRFDGDDPQRYEPVAGTADRSVTAIDIDHHGFVWAINRDHNDAFIVDPGPGIFDGNVDGQIAGFDEPDAFSDMLGSIIRFDTEQRGIWSQTFEACDPGDHYHTEWQTLRFDAVADGGSQLSWRVRAADTEQRLSDASWLTLEPTPPTTSPIDLRALLGEEGLQRAGFIEIEVRLTPNRDGDEFFVPSLAIVDVIADCPQIML